ncbi:hypothetical protein Q8A67_008891 [Cirrhinus molitorella]|uniref:Ig-like domain-containing protein n=1 Tax=Cirrhinus molitorella TaxID=172907 RepID=A0AA88PY08_9TELE|nr:hypothetical protein Q8A67_008891 [Cirrhinus molitorella]
MDLNSVILFCASTAVVFANTISPDTTDVGANEGQNATLSCSYSSSGVTENLFWYRQYGRSKPEFLVATYSTAQETETLLCTTVLCGPQ